MIDLDPTILAAPIKTESQAKAFIKHVADKGAAFHLEDDPHDIVNLSKGLPLFSAATADQVEKRLVETYNLDCWTKDNCPIGYLLGLIEAAEAA